MSLGQGNEIFTKTLYWCPVVERMGSTMMMRLIDYWYQEPILPFSLVANK